MSAAWNDCKSEANCPSACPNVRGTPWTPGQETHLSDETEAQNQRTHGFESAKGRSAQQAQRARTTRSSRAGQDGAVLRQRNRAQGAQPLSSLGPFRKINRRSVFRRFVCLR